MNTVWLVGSVPAFAIGPLSFLPSTLERWGWSLGLRHSLRRSDCNTGSWRAHWPVQPVAPARDKDEHLRVGEWRLCALGRHGPRQLRIGLALGGSLWCGSSSRESLC